MSEKPTHRGALPPGTCVQEFEFREVLGRGGFGITYKGWNRTLEKTVAIKEYMPTDTAVRESDRTVHPKSDDDQEDFQWGLERFLDEARMLARFEGHPGIVGVQQFFQAHGTAYIVMEYLDGQTLGAIYKEDSVLPEQQLRSLLAPLLEALEQVHEAEFLHRDIKPSNIMFRHDRTPVLIDFGAARAAIVQRRPVDDCYRGTRFFAHRAIQHQRRSQPGTVDRHLCFGGCTVPRHDWVCTERFDGPRHG